ncbi:MAG TPA: hypothetical protein VFQ38_05725 [Longimicrobiales bacterium]|nr:hypothetical protein [Longimicrobiales bacterium]
MLDARDYAVVELGAGEAAEAVGGDDSLAYYVGQAIGFAAGLVYCFYAGGTESSWSAWHG